MALYHRGLIHQNFTMNMEDACLSYNLALRIKPDFGQVGDHLFVCPFCLH